MKIFIRSIYDNSVADEIIEYNYLAFLSEKIAEDFLFVDWKILSKGKTDFYLKFKSKKDYNNFIHFISKNDVSFVYLKVIDVVPNKYDNTERQSLFEILDYGDFDEMDYEKFQSTFEDKDCIGEIK